MSIRYTAPDPVAGANKVKLSAIIGKTKLFFVPFCSKTTFQWQEKGAAPDAGSNNPSPNQPEATTLIQSDDEW